MPRSFEVSAESPVSVEQIHAAFSSEDYWLERNAKSTATATLDTMTVDADGTVTVRVTQHVGRQLLPKKMAKLVPGDLKFVMSEIWRPDGDRQFRGQLDFSASGGLGSGSAETWLKPAGTGSHMRYALQVQVKIPLLGGKLEKSIGAGLAKNLEALLDFTAEWIAEHA
jgi:hypothetical protein